MVRHCVSSRATTVSQVWEYATLILNDSRHVNSGVVTSKYIIPLLTSEESTNRLTEARLRFSRNGVVDDEYILGPADERQSDTTDVKDSVRPLCVPARRSYSTNSQ